MKIALLIPVLAGLAFWYLTCILVDTLPFTPVSKPRCTNPTCRGSLSWKDALFLQRCSKCGKPRGVRTWFLLTLFLASSIYIWISPPTGIGFIGGLIVFSYLICVAVIDMEHRLILRPLSIAGIIIGAVTGYTMRGWLYMLIGGAAGFAILGILYLFGKLFTRLRFRRHGTQADGEEALGSGDVTLAVILGLMLGWPLIWFDILLGVLLAGIVSLGIILWFMINKRYGKNAFMIFIPLGPGFILAAILFVYLPHIIAALVPG